MANISNTPIGRKYGTYDLEKTAEKIKELLGMIELLNSQSVTKTDLESALAEYVDSIAIAQNTANTAIINNRETASELFELVTGVSNGTAIGDGVITEDKLADGAVTIDKLQNDIKTALIGIAIYEDRKTVPTVQGDLEFRYLEYAEQTSDNTPDSATYVGVANITGYNGSESSIVIPYEYISPQDVKCVCNKIESMTTPNATLNQIILPNTIVQIGDSAFKNQTGLKNIKIPNSVIAIGEKAFSGCTSLETVKISELVPTLSQIVLPNSNIQLEDSTFAEQAGFNSVGTPINATSIGAEAFSGCTSLKLVEISDKVTSIGENAFKNTSSDLVIMCPYNSYAAEYAHLNGISVRYTDVDESELEIADGSITTSNLSQAFILPIANGGTGANTSNDALHNLGGLKKNIISYDEIDKYGYELLSFYSNSNWNGDVYDKVPFSQATILSTYNFKGISFAVSPTYLQIAISHDDGAIYVRIVDWSTCSEDDDLVDVSWTKVDEDIINAINSKADKDNTVLTGSLSLGRTDGSTIGKNSSAVGTGVTALKKDSQADGEHTKAAGDASHAEGAYTTTSGYASHSEGEGTQTFGRGSHSEGYKTIARGSYQHVQGKYNKENVNAAFIIGNGYYNNDPETDERSNALEVDWQGNMTLAGGLILGMVDTLPQAVAGYRGKQIILKDDTNGDKLYICVSKGNSTYEWVAMDNIPDGVITTDKLASDIKNNINSREIIANKGQANGYAPLDALGKIPDSYLYGTTVKQYGVRYDGTSSTICTRLGDAVGLVANAQLGSTTDVTNDFNSIYPWCDMKLCNVDTDGNILAFIGDPAFKRDDTTKFSGNGSTTIFTIPSKPQTVHSVTVNGTVMAETTDYIYNNNTGIITFTEAPVSGVNNIVIIHSVWDVMVRVPKFYYKRVKIENQEEWWICGTKIPGYELHPLFQNNGQEVSQVFIGAYLANSITENETTVLKSMSNVAPTVSITRDESRTRARAKGSMWGILDLSALSAIQMLYLVEYANTNSRAMLGNGVADMNYTNTHIQLKNAENTNTFTLTTVFANKYRVGERINIGTVQTSANKANNRKIISITTSEDDEDISEIVFDGDPISSLTVGCLMWSAISWSGDCDELNGGSGYVGENKRKAVSYRGIENVFGNVYQYIDGVNIRDHVAYISNNLTQYADNTWTGSYQALGYTNASANGFVNSQGYDERYPWAMFPIATSGAAGSYYCNYYYQNVGDRGLTFGGNWISSSFVGLFCYYSSVTFGSKSLSQGARLLIKKS